MEVLVYKCEDYTITVKTSDLSSSWKRFSTRVQDADSYADYVSTRKGLSLGLAVMEGDKFTWKECGEGYEWKHLPPVFFETETYHFYIDFTCPLLGSPKLVHARRSVTDSFDYHRGMLTGSVNFLNHPGTFHLQFSYIRQDGESFCDSLSLEVVSPKLDTKRDLKNIKQLIHAEYENYIYEFLSLTFQNQEIARDDKADSKVIWLSIFKQVADSYFRSCRYIMKHANRKAQRRNAYARAAQIKRWKVSEEERFMERGVDAECFYYQYETTDHTINTKENRFVKYSLKMLQRRFLRVFDELQRAYGDDLSDTAREQLSDYAATFQSLLHSKFFRSVGNYEGHLQESSVLQQRTGYRNIYKYWQLLKCALTLEEGKTGIGMKQVWHLYELWCFLVMKRLVCRIFELDPRDPKVYEEGWIVDHRSKLLDSFDQKNIDYQVTYIHPTTRVKVELKYQHPYAWRKGEAHSETTLQVPDIVLNVKKPTDDITFTYLFDAKYRVLDDKNHDTPTDEPVQDTINAMHRYRDAIYYGSMIDDEGAHRPQSKEVIGGYILFPGRVSDLDKLESKYFSQSIQSVNIGAYPLLPCDLSEDDDFADSRLVECDKLEQDLRRIILENSQEDHLSNAVPQKGLYYTDEALKDALVYVGYVKPSNPFYDDFLQNRAVMYYTGSEDTKPNIDLQCIRYFLPLIGGKIGGVYKVDGIRVARKSEKLEHSDLADDGVRLFLMLGDFIEFGEPVAYHNLLHNASTLSYEEARERYARFSLET